MKNCFIKNCGSHEATIRKRRKREKKDASVKVCGEKLIDKEKTDREVGVLFLPKSKIEVWTKLITIKPTSCPCFQQLLGNIAIRNKLRQNLYKFASLISMMQEEERDLRVSSSHAHTHLQLKRKKLPISKKKWTFIRSHGGPICSKAKIKNKDEERGCKTKWEAQICSQDKAEVWAYSFKLISVCLFILNSKKGFPQAVGCYLKTRGRYNRQKFETPFKLNTSLLLFLWNKFNKFLFTVGMKITYIDCPILIINKEILFRMQYLKNFEK